MGDWESDKDTKKGKDDNQARAALIREESAKGLLKGNHRRLHLINDW